jgi:hypothetical protein
MRSHSRWIWSSQTPNHRTAEQLHTGMSHDQASENHTQMPLSSQSVSYAASKDERDGSLLSATSARTYLGLKREPREPSALVAESPS